MMCLDLTNNPDIAIKGEYGSLEFWFVKFTFTQCKNKNPANIVCADQTEVQKYFSKGKNKMQILFYD